MRDSQFVKKPNKFSTCTGLNETEKHLPAVNHRLVVGLEKFYKKKKANAFHAEIRPRVKE